MTDRYETIRNALEMGPTPGPWFHGAANGAHMYCVYDKRCWTDEDGARHGETPNMVVVVSPDDGKYANAAHIAACDPDTIRALLEERDALAAKVESLRTDAERYRWLRKGESDDVAVVRGLGAMDYGMSAVVSTYSEEIDGDDLDADIDAALRGEVK